jgi:hypothetical protein
VLSKYSSVEIRHTRITDVRNHESLFELFADNSAVVSGWCLPPMRKEGVQAALWFRNGPRLLDLAHCLDAT